MTAATHKPTSITVSDCCNAPITNSGILLYVTDATPGMWCSACRVPCNEVTNENILLAEWNIAFEMSRQVLENFMEDMVGVKMCPAHAARIRQMCDDQEMPDFPKNPGRKA